MLGTGYQQEVHLEKLFMDVAEYDEMIHVPVQIPTLVDLPCATPWPGGPCPTSRSRTTSRWQPPTSSPTRRWRRPWSSRDRADLPARARAAPSRRPAPAAEVLNAGTKVVMLVGAGALHARDEVLAVAEALASPIVKTLPGKAVVPDDHPLTTGGIGLLGTKPSEEAMEAATPCSWWAPTSPTPSTCPPPGQVRCVQIEADPVRAGNRMPTEVPLVGDAKETLAALLPMLARKQDRSFLAEAQDGDGGLAASAWPRSREHQGPDPTAVPDAGRRPAGRRRRHPDLGLGDHRHLVGPPLRHPGRPPVLPVGQPGHHGARSALRHRRPMGPSGPAVHRLRRRRRIRHADGRVRHRRPLPAARQGDHQQQRRARPDHVGADGARLPRVRRSASSSELDFAPWAEACGGKGIRVDKADRARGGRRRSAGVPRSCARRRRPSIPTSRPCPPRSPTSRPRPSPRPSSGASPTRRPSPRPCSGTRLRRSLRSRASAQGIDRFIRDVETRPLRAGLCALTAVGAAVTGAEIWLEHDRASFGNHMMWLPVAITPCLSASPPWAGSSPSGWPRRCCRSSRRSWWPTASKASTCTCGASPSGPAGSSWPATTPRWARRPSRLCCSPWSAAWVCSPRCCAARTVSRARAASRPGPAEPRFPGYDVLAQTRSLGRRHRRRRARPAAAAGRRPVLHRARSTDGPGPAGPAAGPGRRAPSPGARADRPPPARPATATATATRTCPRTGTAGGGPSPASTTTPTLSRPAVPPARPPRSR